MDRFLVMGAYMAGIPVLAVYAANPIRLGGFTGFSPLDKFLNIGYVYRQFSTCTPYSY